MEIFRPLDGLATAIADATPPLEQWRKFVYCESLTGRVFGEVDHFKVRQLLHCCKDRGHSERALAAVILQ